MTIFPCAVQYTPAAYPLHTWQFVPFNPIPCPASSPSPLVTTSLFFFFFFNHFKMYVLFYFIFYQLSVLYTSVYTCQSQSPNSSHPHHPHPRLSPLGVHTFVLYICVSISALQTGSLVPFFQVPHICVNIRYLFFSF